MGLSSDNINMFKGEYRFLSNFYRTPVTYGGLTYPSSENAYQAQKCANESDKLLFLNIRSGEAKRLGRTVEQRHDWDDVKVQIMYEIVRIKFENEEMRALLLTTGAKLLIEGNYHNDAFWGYDLKKGKGLNRLGNIIMRVRTEIQWSLVRHLDLTGASFED